MARHKSRRRKLGDHPFFAVATTELDCTREDREAFKMISLSIRTSCIDSSPACDHKNQLIVRASCPSKGAAIAFEKSIGRIAGALSVARGIARRRS